MPLVSIVDMRQELAQGHRQLLSRPLIDRLSLLLETKEQAVKNINLNVKGGSLTALVGHSGAGKSTIFNLLPRFYNLNKGQILIDNQDISEVSINSLSESEFIIPLFNKRVSIALTLNSGS